MNPRSPPRSRRPVWPRTGSLRSWRPLAHGAASWGRAPKLRRHSRPWCNRVELSRDGLRLSLKVPMPAAGAGNDPPSADAIVTRFIPLQLKRRGAELRLIVPDAHTPRTKVDLALLKAVGRARRWFD